MDRAVQGESAGKAELDGGAFDFCAFGAFAEDVEVGAGDLGECLDEVGDALDGVEAAEEADGEVVGLRRDGQALKFVGVEGVGDDDYFVAGDIGPFGGGDGDGG